MTNGDENFFSELNRADAEFKRLIENQPENTAERLERNMKDCITRCDFDV